MERTTGFSLSITGQLQATGAIAPAGVHTPDECVPGERYMAELAKRGIVIRDTGDLIQCPSAPRPRNNRLQRVLRQERMPSSLWRHPTMLMEAL